jgi:fibronectin type 3 domain-containing protein
VVGYNVYQGTVSGGPYAKLTSTPVSAVQYTDTTVQSGQTYFYVVTAVDSSNDESAFSNQAVAAIP